jgi:hypothetical protein
MLANSGRSRLTSSGSSWDLAGLICIGLAMRAGAAGILPVFTALPWQCEPERLVSEVQLAKLLLGWLAWWMPAVVGGVDSLMCCFLDKGVIVTVAARVRVTLQLTVSQSVCLGVEPRKRYLFFGKLLSCPYGAPSLTRGRVCHLSESVSSNRSVVGIYIIHDIYEGKSKIIRTFVFQFIYTKVGVEQVRHFST